MRRSEKLPEETRIRFHAHALVLDVLGITPPRTNTKTESFEGWVTGKSRTEEDGVLETRTPRDMNPIERRVTTRSTSIEDSYETKNP